MAVEQADMASVIVAVARRIYPPEMIPHDFEDVVRAECAAYIARNPSSEAPLVTEDLVRHFKENGVKIGGFMPAVQRDEKLEWTMIDEASASPQIIKGQVG